MSDHGAHFDVFTQQAGSPHGGAEYDTGFGLQGLADPHGEHFDRFIKSGNVTKHGERWDEFGWKEMPRSHGRNFDADFAGPTAHDGEHGTWFDVFRGGTQLRYVGDGNGEYEAVVIDLHADHAVVERKDGARDEIELSQILMWREGNATNTQVDAQPDRPAPGFQQDAARGGAIASMNTESIPASDAEAPSAHDATARGGGARSPIDPQMESPVMTVKAIEEVFDVGKLKLTNGGLAAAAEAHRANLGHISKGDYGKVSCPGCGEKGSYDIGHQPMKGPKAGKSKMFGACRGCGFKHTFPPPKIKRQPAPSKLAGKTADDELDVEKARATSAANGFGRPSVYTHHGDTYCGSCKPGGAAQAAPGSHSSYHGKECAGCGQLYNANAGRRDSAWADRKVGKSIDSSETAVQGETGAQQGGSNWCPACQHTCRKVEDGKCPTCGGPVKAVSKTALDVLADVRKMAGLA